MRPAGGQAFDDAVQRPVDAAVGSAVWWLWPSGWWTI